MQGSKTQGVLFQSYFFLNANILMIFVLPMEGRLREEERIRLEKEA